MDSVFERLYEEYHQDIFQFLFYMVKNRQHAEDLSQEVYIRVLRSYHRFEGKSSEKTWMIAIARNVAIDFFRKEKGWKQRLLERFDLTTQQVKDDSHPMPEEITVLNEEIQFMYRCLDRCTVDQKLVIIMRYIQQFSIKETAVALNWSESKVKTTQHRALKVLHKYMTEIYNEGGRNDEAK